MLNETAICGTVTNVESVPMPDLGTPEGMDYMKYYGLDITTEHGTATVDFRNESNGYYGGYLLVEKKD